MIRVEITSRQMDELFNEFTKNEHPVIRRKALVLYLKGLGLLHKQICEICRITKPTLTEYLKEYLANGIEWLLELKWKGQPSDLNAYEEEIRENFGINPPTTINEAKERIRDIADIERCPTQIRVFMKRIGLKLRKVGAIPGNIRNDDDNQKKENEREEFKKNF